MFLCAASAVRTAAALTSAELDWYTTEIRSVIEDDRDLLPKFVRLSFHDCVGVGGCNGCVDLNNPDNGGLDVPIDALEAIFNDNNAPSLSRADLWALAGLVAARRGAQLARGTVPEFRFRFGREDCATSPQGASNDVLPSASSLGTTEVFDFFDEKFGFNEDETVALMGAHTLGRCSEVCRVLVLSETCCRSFTHTPFINKLPRSTNVLSNRATCRATTCTSVGSINHICNTMIRTSVSSLIVYGFQWIYVCCYCTSYVISMSF